MKKIISLLSLALIATLPGCCCKDKCKTSKTEDSETMIDEVRGTKGKRHARGKHDKKGRQSNKGKHEGKDRKHHGADKHEGAHHNDHRRTMIDAE